MGPRRFVLLAVTLFSITTQTVADMECSPPALCTCPQTSFGWVLFSDSTPGVPDFWCEDSLVVEEIAVCPHGIRFEFLAEHDGTLGSAAIVFPDPSRDPRETGMRLDPDGTRWGMDIAHFKRRYSNLRNGLDRMSGAPLRTGCTIDFRKVDPVERPVILDPARRLVLRWKGVEMELRGYLDVYTNSFV